MINITSGEVYENLLLTTIKNELSAMIFCPKDNFSLLMAGDIEGRIILFNSSLKGKKEKKDHIVMLSHE